MSITATDGHDLANSQAFTLTVDPSAPSFTSAASTTFAENTGGSFSVTADGDGPLGYSMTSPLPAGVTLSASGTLSGTPAYGAAGTYPVTVTVTDANSATTAQALTLTVSTSPASFTSANSTTFAEDAARDLQRQRRR